MAFAAAETVFSIPFRYLWSTNFAGDLEAVNERPNGLARFVGDEKNQILKILAADHAADLVNPSATQIWPLVLFGSSGTGKTSLALSIVSDLADRSTNSAERSVVETVSRSNQKVRTPDKPIVISAADFDRRFRSALATDSVTDFRRRLIRCRGLVIDDVQRLADKPAAQHELLQVIDQMLLRNRPLVLTMDCDPQHLTGLIPQLVSRFCGGLSLPVHAPGQAARNVILHDLCEIHHLDLTPDAISLLVEKLNVTVPKMVHFFAQLKLSQRAELALNKKKTDSIRIDAAFITRMFRRSDSDLTKLSKAVITQVAREFKVKPKDIRSDSRKQSIVLARGVAIYLSRKLLGISFLKIGALFGNRDHSTIMHAYRKIEKLVQDASEQLADENLSTGFRQRVAKLEQSLTNQFASEILAT